MSRYGADRFDASIAAARKDAHADQRRHPDHQGPSFASSFILIWIRRANTGVRRLPICIEDVTNPGVQLISVDDRKCRKGCTVRDAKFVIDVTEVNLHCTLG